MRELLKRYVDEFNKDDEELYVNDIPNEKAYDWLKDRIPLFECPDKQLERTYYFRWWTYRKHIKTTPEGYVITEFMPNVPWAGKYDVINAPAGHHFYEGRWLRNSDDIFSDYLRYYLNHSEASHVYSVWLLNSAQEYENVRGALAIGKKELMQMTEYYAEWERTHKHSSGLFWSIDVMDAMEASISGGRHGHSTRGFRPTLNSYMYAEAMAIAYFAEKLGETQMAAEFESKAENIKALMNERLMYDGFYKARHGECDQAETEESYKELDEIAARSDDTGSPMELIGYIPYMFGIPELRYSSAFGYLSDPEIFLAKTGMTTADKRHPRYLEENKHECLWNGYVWPFATSQVLTGLIKTIHSGRSELKDVMLKHLQLYSESHIINKDGKILPWIDEVMSPNEYEWTARTKLLGRSDIKERGKDYNHSSFCDLVITGLVGVRTDTETLELDAAIPSDWDYMKLDELMYRGKLYTVVYDRTGDRYGLGKGITIIEKG